MNLLHIAAGISLVSSALAHPAWAEEAPQPGKNFINQQGMNMVWAGHFWISEKEVTQEQFAKLGFKDESTWRKGEKDAAANNVSWVSAIKFCAALATAEQGKIPPGATYVLPTVQQWREAKKSDIKDMDGGVTEWCLDKFTTEMVNGNRAAGVSNAHLFMPASTAGLYAAMGASWKNPGLDFAKGILPVPPVAKGDAKDKSEGDARFDRLKSGEMGFRVALVPPVKQESTEKRPL